MIIRARPMAVLPRRLLKLAFPAASFAALWFALISVAPVEQLKMFHLRGDHLVHALTFAVLTILGLLLWAPAWLVGLIMLGAGGGVELLQLPVGRDAELSDWIAGSVGVGFGALLFFGFWIWVPTGVLRTGIGSSDRKTAGEKGSG